MGHPVPPTTLGQVPLQPLPQVLGKAVLRPPGPGVPGGRVSPHVSMGRATCPLFWAAALGAASSNRSHTATHTAMDAQTRMPNTRAPPTPQSSNMYD